MSAVSMRGIIGKDESAWGGWVGVLEMRHEGCNEGQDDDGQSGDWRSQGGGGNGELGNGNWGRDEGRMMNGEMGSAPPQALLGAGFEIGRRVARWRSGWRRRGGGWGCRCIICGRGEGGDE